MPMIQLTAPTGALPDDGRGGLQQALAKTLLKWEGAPDTAFFRAQAWSYFIELPEGAQATAEDALPRFRVVNGTVAIPDVPVVDADSSWNAVPSTPTLRTGRSSPPQARANAANTNTDTRCSCIFTSSRWS